MKIKSKVTGITYEEKDCVFFLNPLQSAQYCLWGAKLIDVYPNSDRRFVFVFSKAEHQKYKLRWKNGEGKKNE